MNCALCKKFPTREESHIIPSFVIRWLKKTSATGYLRGTEEPNKRMQDGRKYPLLCENCEDLFSEDERMFASKVFHPSVEDMPKRFQYDEFFLRFAVSLVWRALHHVGFGEGSEKEPLQPELVGKLEEPYKVWSDFLLGVRPHPGEFVVNVLPMDFVVEKHPSNPLPSGINRYFARAIDMDLICTETTGHVFVKIPHFCFFGRIFLKRRDPFSKNTLLRKSKGILGGSILHVDGSIIKYLHSRCEHASQVAASLSERQNEIIRNTLKKDPGRMVRSHSMQAWKYDKQLFD